MAQSKDNEKTKNEQVLDKQKDAKQKTSQSQTTSGKSGEKKSESKADNNAVKEKDKKQKTTAPKESAKAQSNEGAEKKGSGEDKNLTSSPSSPLSFSSKEKEAAQKVENDDFFSKPAQQKISYASEEYTNVGNIVADRAANTREDFYATELNSPQMGMGGVFPMSPSMAVARESERGSAGSVVVLMLLATLLVLFVIGIVTAGGSLTPSGNITGSNSIRYGEATTLTYGSEEKSQLKEGDEIVWLVDGKEVQRLSYKDKNAYSYTLKDAKVGARKVKVIAGNRLFSETDVAVGKPLVTVTVKDAQYTYGEKAPQAAYSFSGLRDGDKENVINVKSVNSNVPSNRRSAGEYSTRLSASSTDGKYDVEVKQGTITVKPKEIKIANKISKEYDGTNVLSCDKLEISGAMPNDDVNARCDCFYFESKNAGENKISTYNIELTGEDAKNYTVCSELKGTITPKVIMVEEMAVKNKAYDGKDSVEFKSAGRLSGIVKGDVVAIGDIDAAFENAEVGENKNVKINKINLVGRDKGNYRFVAYPKVGGSIYKNPTDVIPSN